MQLDQQDLDQYHAYNQHGVRHSYRQTGLVQRFYESEDCNCEYNILKINSEYFINIF